MKIRPTLLVSPSDINFMLHEWLRVAELTSTERYGHLAPVDFDALLDMSLDFAERAFAPHNRLSDSSEPSFDGTRVSMIPEIKDALDRFADAGLLAASMPLSVDGGQVPHVVYRACYAFLQAANLATAAYPMLTAANANLLLEHGSADDVDRYVRPMIEGRFFGTMCLSEPQAGSSLADVATRAVAHADGTFSITGSKMWISGGDHELSENIVHLVLARVPGAPPGVKGLSLFIVPKFLVNDDGSLGDRNDIVLAGLNHKMGYRGTVNTVLSFGDRGEGATGWLVGEQGLGLAYMFLMMNEARIGVGAGAAAVGYTSYLHALEYARTRVQGRPIDAKDPSSPQVPIAEHADVRRMLLASKSYVEGGLALALYAARELDLKLAAATEEEAREHSLMLDILTPIVKGWNSKWSLVACDFAIQVHGGAGYTRDFPVEQFWRDNRLNPIHEGTDGIQAMDLLGRKVPMEGGAAFDVLVGRIRETVAQATASGGDAAALARQLKARVMALCEVTDSVLERPTASRRLADATLYADAFGHIVVGWLWLEQVLACSAGAKPIHRGKRAAAAYFFHYELPQVDAWLAAVAAEYGLLTDLDPADL